MNLPTFQNAWSSLKNHFSARNKRFEAVHDLYAEIVEQARNPFFYSRLEVPDSLDGRFDLIVLHLHLVSQDLAVKGDVGKELEQKLMGLFFADMDRSLREMGVGDLSVGKKIRTMAEAYFGRTKAYSEALASADPDALKEAVRRNVYGGEEMDRQASVLAEYAHQVSSVLREIGGDQMFEVASVKRSFRHALSEVVSDGDA